MKNSLMEEMTKIENSYREGKSLMPDRMWDDLISTLPDDGSGTYALMMDSGKSRPSLPLLAPAGSLTKTNSIAKARSMFEKLQATGHNVYMSLKYDGAAMIQRFVLESTNGKKAVYRHKFDLTRGDGKNGKLVHSTAFTRTKYAKVDRVTVNYKLFDSICSDWPEEIEIRGELYSPSEKINRSVASGILNRKYKDSGDGTTDSEVIFVVYAVVANGVIIRDIHSNISSNMKIPTGWRVVESLSINSADDLEYMIRWYTKAEDDKGYVINGIPVMLTMPIDGLVISTDRFDCKQADAKTSGFLAWNAFAVKLMHGCYKTKVINIHSHQTDAGNEVMTCKITPIKTVDGRTIKKLNLHNPLWYNRVAKSWLYPGSEIYVTGDVIPVPVNPSEINEARVTKGRNE